MAEEPTLSVKEVADLLGVNRVTVYKWIKQGRLAPERSNYLRRGGIRIPLPELERFKREG